MKRHGITVLGTDPNFFEIEQIDQTIRIVEVYGAAGTPRQKNLSPGDWLLVKELDTLAREDASTTD